MCDSIFKPAFVLQLLKCLASVCLALVVLSGCSRKPAAANPALATRPPAEVETFDTITEKVTDYRVYTGRTAAVNSVDVRARVSGYLLQCPQSQSVTTSSEPSSEASEAAIPEGQFRVLVHEGDRVSKGTPLFEIDPAPYQLILSQAEGTLVATRAQLKRFELDLARAKDLLKSNSISKSDYDLAVANEAEAMGQIANLEATVNRAKLDLRYTQVISPIDGLLGRTLITKGNLVTADTTILISIVSTDPIQVYFDVDENSVLDYRSRMRSGSVKSARETSIPVSLGLANNVDFPYAGVIDFVNNATDPNTGNTRIRAQFSNESGALSPGLFARVRVPFSAEHAALLVPTRALGMDQQGKYVLVVDDGNIVRRKSVRVGIAHGSMTVITEGIAEGEKVIVSGLQKARNGDKVQIKAKPPADGATPTTPKATSESTSAERRS